MQERESPREAEASGLVVAVGDGVGGPALRVGVGVTVWVVVEVGLGGGVCCVLGPSWRVCVLCIRTELEGVCAVY